MQFKIFIAAFAAKIFLHLQLTRLVAVAVVNSTAVAVVNVTAGAVNNDAKSMLQLQLIILNIAFAFINEAAICSYQ